MIYDYRNICCYCKLKITISCLISIIQATKKDPHSESLIVNGAGNGSELEPFTSHISDLIDLISNIPQENDEDAINFAQKAGYPVIVKATAGGGKGMRIANNDKELVEAIALCKTEAEKAFDKRRVYQRKLQYRLY